MTGYPTAHVVWCDPATDETKDLGRMPDDPRQMYGYPPAVDGDNRMLYVPVGLHHLEVWAYDLRIGKKRQILPPELTKKQGNPEVYRGSDGRVYGRAYEWQFLCKPDGIEYVDTLPAAARTSPYPKEVGEHTVSHVTADGELHLKHKSTGGTKVIQTAVRGGSFSIHCVGCEHDGKIYGGGGNGKANLFVFDPATGKLKDLGRKGGGRVQVYDVLSHPRGLFQSSYTGCHLDFYDLVTGKRKPIASLSREHEQERARELVLGPDGMIYTGTVPVKGRLGGAIVRLDPSSGAVRVWRNVIPNQSFLSAVAVPQTGEMFFTSSTHGGSSAIPTEKEAYVALWDIKKGQIAWKGQPFEGAELYWNAVMARNGLIYGLMGNKLYAFDPVRREVVHRGRLPTRSARFPGLATTSRGESALIYGLGDGAVFTIDPSDNSTRIIARHPSLRNAVGLLVAKGGTLYYGSGPNLWRAKLNP